MTKLKNISWILIIILFWNSFVYAIPVGTENKYLIKNTLSPKTNIHVNFLKNVYKYLSNKYKNILLSKKSSNEEKSGKILSSEQFIRSIVHLLIPICAFTFLSPWFFYGLSISSLLLFLGYSYIPILDFQEQESAVHKYFEVELLKSLNNDELIEKRIKSLMQADFINVIKCEISPYVEKYAKSFESANRIQQSSTLGLDHKQVSQKNFTDGDSSTQSFEELQIESVYINGSFLDYKFMETGLSFINDLDFAVVVKGDFIEIIYKTLSEGFWIEDEIGGSEIKKVSFFVIGDEVLKGKIPVNLLDSLKIFSFWLLRFDVKHIVSGKHLWGKYHNATLPVLYFSLFSHVLRNLISVMNYLFLYNSPLLIYSSDFSLKIMASVGVILLIAHDFFGFFHGFWSLPKFEKRWRSMKNRISFLIKELPKLFMGQMNYDEKIIVPNNYNMQTKLLKNLFNNNPLKKCNISV
ncbi:MAG: hypothetical protein ACD_79C00787G0001 [uncultured bacterium]|nr:MAG: hypothetical protein ACD_79C00787G0001 [uncultured bacterium]